MVDLFRSSKLVLLMVSVMLLSASIVVADEGSLDWFTEYHHSDFRHQGFSATLDSESNIVMTGFIEELDATENDRWKVIKVTPEGDVLWELDLPMTSSSDYTSITNDVDNNIYIASSMTLPGEGNFTHVNKVGADGNLIWNKVLEDIWRLRDIHSREDGLIVVTGLGFNSSTYFKVSTLHADDEMNGSILWSTEVDSIGGYGAHHLRFSGLDSSNRITLMGVVEDFDVIRVGWVRILGNGDRDISGIYSNETSSAASFIGNAALSPEGQLYGLLSLDHNFDTVLFAVNEDGEQVWDQEFNQFLHLDNLGSIVFEGNDPILSLLNGNNTLSTYKFSSTGELTWESITNTFLKSLNRNSMAIDDEGGLYISGKNTSIDEPFSIIRLLPNGGNIDWSLNFGNTNTMGGTYNNPGMVGFYDGGLVGASLLDATHNEDYGFVAYRIELITNSTPETGSDLLPSEFKVDTYPNPFNAFLNVKMNISNPGEVNVRLVDMLGRSVYDTREYIGNSNHILSVNAVDLSSGMYLLSVSDQKGNRLTKRVTLLK